MEIIWSLIQCSQIERNMPRFLLETCPPVQSMASCQNKAKTIWNLLRYQASLNWNELYPSCIPAGILLHLVCSFEFILLCLRTAIPCSYSSVSSTSGAKPNF